MIPAQRAGPDGQLQPTPRATRRRLPRAAFRVRRTPTLRVGGGEVVTGEGDAGSVTHVVPALVLLQVRTSDEADRTALGVVGVLREGVTARDRARAVERNTRAGLPPSARFRAQPLHRRRHYARPQCPPRPRLRPRPPMTYNLTTEPWIHVRWTAGGSTEVSLRDALAEAHRIAERSRQARSKPLRCTGSCKRSSSASTSIPKTPETTPDLMKPSGSISGMPSASTLHLKSSVR